jgi:outer membrane protein
MKWSFGVAGLYSSNEYYNEDSNLMVLPSIGVESELFSFSMPEGIKWKAYKTKDISLDVSISPRFHSLSNTDSSNFESFDRKLTADGVLGLKWKVARGTTLKGDIKTEITNEHNGNEIDISISQFIPPVLGTPIILTGGVSWLDSNLSNYLYGVSASETNSNFQVYNTGDSLNPYIGITTFYEINENTNLVGNVNYKFLSKDIKRSPIVDDDYKIGVIVGIEYSY